MRFSPSVLLLRFVMAFCALAGTCSAAFGAEPSARAILSPSTTGLREPVQLQIQISDGGTDIPEPKLSVDGLDIRYLGPSSNSSFRVENGRMSRSTTLTHIYQVLPLREGTFTIPPIALEANGRSLRTDAIKLVVQASGSRGTAAQTGQNATGFAEIVVTKNSAYVGEMVPVEVRLYVDSQVRAELEQMPVLEGDGFTKQKMPQPRRERARRGGRDYDVIVFRTAITPSKAGKITLGPSEIIFLAQIQQRRNRQPRSLLGDILGEDFFDDPFFAPMQMKRVAVKASAVDLEVKPLPTQGRPPSFSGAVGQFKLVAEGSPTTVKAGDPITMKLAISGRGNFDRVKEPTVTDPAGWHPYPARNDFKPEDDLTLTGTKTFEMAVIPEVKKTAMPVFEFSYFDPEAEDYVTLMSGRLPLEVEGTIGRPPASVPGHSVSAAIPAKPAEDLRRTQQPADILGLRYQFGAVKKSFTPLHQRRVFWVAQLAPLAGLLGFASLRLLRKGESARREGALRHEAHEMWRSVRSAEAEAALFDSAARLVQIEAALATGADPSTIDASAAIASRSLDPGTAAEIERIFESRAERLYAGTAQAGTAVSAAARERIATALERFQNSHGKK